MLYIRIYRSRKYCSNKIKSELTETASRVGEGPNSITCKLNADNPYFKIAAEIRLPRVDWYLS
jgi:hypothetical protein